MYKFKIQFVLLMFFWASVNAQEHKKLALIKGNVIIADTKEPIHDLKITIPDLNQITTTDGDGDFSFNNVPYGTQKIVISNYNIKADTIVVTVNNDLVDLGQITAQPNRNAGAANRSTDIPTIALEENEVTDAAGDDEGVSTQNVSGILTASRDPFLRAASFVFFPYHFQPRGYDRNQQEVQINGIEMNDLETGDATWSQWGGLNDVFRSRDMTYGLAPSDNSFGGLLGSTYFDATAANQHKGVTLTYSAANRNYRNRLMATVSSGMLKNGWAYSFSGSKRWAQEGYTPGTFYDGYSYYAAVSKVMRKNEFDFTAFGAPTRRGKPNFATQEADNLAGTNFYNPNWGYQNGVKRNSRVANIFQPMFVLNHTYKPSSKTTLKTALAYQFGANKSSAIDWYNGIDPRPDYYRNLPSYYMNTTPPDPTSASAVQEYMQQNPDALQLNWDRLYNVNYINTQTVNDVNGIAGNDVTGKESIYVLGDYVSNIKKWQLNSTLRHEVNEHITFNTGITFIAQADEEYKELEDLLGGDFYTNYNQFAARAFVGSPIYYQNDLNNPNRIIKVGDKYSYDYMINYYKGWWWGQTQFTYNKVDFFVAANIGMTSFSRDGLMRNGLFPNNSFGTSAANNFFTYGVKGGATYKIDGRNYLFLNGGVSTEAPDVDNTYISPRTRDFVVDNAQVQLSKSLEGGYMLKSPNVSARVVGYVTDVDNATQIKHYYNDAPQYQTFVNYVMTNVDMRFIGTELALEVKVTPSLSVSGVAALGQAFYTSRPNVSIYLDDDTTKNSTQKTVYLKNYYVAVGPQTNYTLGLHNTFKKGFWGSIDFNYFDRNYVDINPDRRSADAAGLITPGSEAWHQVFDQEKLPSAFTVDVSAGKYIHLSKILKKLPERDELYLSAGIDNLLDNKNIITSGYEYLRYDYANTNPNKFQNKYFYGYGLNFFINASFRF